MKPKRWDKPALVDLGLKVSSDTLTDFAGYESRNALYESVAAMAGSSDAWTRWAVMNILCHLDQKRAFPYLQTCLGDVEEDIRASAIEFLYGRGERIVPLVLPLLSDDSFVVRRAAALALGESGTLEVLPALQSAAQRDGECEKQSRIGPYAKHAIKQIKARSQGKDSARDQLEPEPHGKPDDTNIEGTKWTKAELSDLRNRVVAHKQRTDFPGYDSCDALLDSIAAAIDSSDDDVRLDVLFITWHLNRERSFPQLENCLRDPDEGVRIWAIRFLTFWGPRGVPLVAPLVLGDPSPDVRREAVATLSNFGTAEILPILRACAERDDELDFEDCPISAWAEQGIKDVVKRSQPGAPPRRRPGLQSRFPDEELN